MADDREELVGMIHREDAMRNLHDAVAQRELQDNATIMGVSASLTSRELNASAQGIQTGIASAMAISHDQAAIYARQRRVFRYSSAKEPFLSSRFAHVSTSAYIPGMVSASTMRFETESEEALTQEEVNEVLRRPHSRLKSDEYRLKKAKEEKQERKDAQAKKAYEDKKAELKAGRISLVDDDIVQSRWMRENVLEKEAYNETIDGKKQSVTQEALVEKIKGGDYSHLEQLDVVLRYRLASEYMMNLQIEDGATPQEVVDGIYRNQGVAGLMNPLLRIAISMFGRGEGIDQCEEHLGGFTADMFKEMDGLMNQRIMERTILTIPDISALRQMENLPSVVSQTEQRAEGGVEGFATKENAEKRKTLNEALDLDMKSKVFMVKTLLSAQLSRLSCVKGNVSGAWQGPIANAFAHCSRIGVVLPGSDGSAASEEETIQALQGNGFTQRMASTHKLERKSKKAGGSGFVEGKAKPFNLSRQYGMNVAVGGLGEQGLAGSQGQARALMNNGTCGHIFMHVNAGDTDHYTGVLIGFESDEYQKTNQLGHTHKFGNGEFQSSFGGQRVDEIGNKYGGRIADLSGLGANAYKLLMASVEKFVTDAFTDPQKYSIFEDMVEHLAGRQMTPSELEFYFLKGALYENVSDGMLTAGSAEYQELKNYIYR